MFKTPFSKTPTSYAEQIQKLRSRGLTIQDEVSATAYLKHLSYYRLGAYWLPFEADHQSHQFKTGTAFEDVLNLYVFDRELRILLIDAIERFEVSVRALWSHHLSLEKGAHAHMDKTLAKNESQWEFDIQKLKGEVDRSHEVFIQHFKKHYAEELPPIWAVTEVVSLGSLSKWYKNLGPKKLRTAIAQHYRIDERVLQSWLHHLVIVRNMCAHHARLWNRDFTFTIQIPKSKTKALSEEFRQNSRKLYNTLILLLHCMDIIAPEHHWRQRLIALIDAHHIPVYMMGFPQDWQTRYIWNDSRS